MILVGAKLSEGVKVLDIGRGQTLRGGEGA